MINPELSNRRDGLDEGSDPWTDSSPPALMFAVALGEGGERESSSVGTVFAIITVLNAALFYLMGLGAIKKASKRALIKMP